MAFDGEMRLASPSGADLRLLSKAAQGPARAVVQVNHGLSEHAGRYARLSAFLSAHGFHVLAHDHRGHGKTKAEGAPLGHFGPGANADTILADVGAVHDHIASIWPGLPVFVFGHSMGGMIALTYALRHSRRIAGVAAWNAPFATRLEALAGKAVLAVERFRLGSDVPSRLVPRLTFGSWARAFPQRRTEFDWLSRVPEEVDRYVQDPLCGLDVSIGIWTVLFELSLIAANRNEYKATRKDLPLHLVGGGADPSTDGGKIVQRTADILRRNGFGDVTIRLYPLARHETLNEPEADEAMRDLLSWIEGNLDRKNHQLMRK